MYKKIFVLVDLFGHVLTILAWTKCRLVTKHLLSSTHFHSCFFLTFPVKFYLYNKFKLSIKDYLLLNYTFMCMIIFLRIICNSKVSKVTKPAFFTQVWEWRGILTRVWEWRGIGTDCPGLVAGGGQGKKASVPCPPCANFCINQKENMH